MRFWNDKNIESILIDKDVNEITGERGSFERRSSLALISISTSVACIEYYTFSRLFII